MKQHVRADVLSHMRRLCVLAAVCAVPFAAFGDYITDEYDRQWRELELSIADAGDVSEQRRRNAHIAVSA